jgi:hypothetical protein
MGVSTCQEQLRRSAPGSLWKVFDNPTMIIKQQTLRPSSQPPFMTAPSHNQSSTLALQRPPVCSPLLNAYGLCSDDWPVPNLPGSRGD